MVKRLLEEGFYTNIGIFPGVPVKCCGLRLAVTNGQTEDDIRNVLDAFQYHFPRVLESEGQTVEDIQTNFNMSFEPTVSRYSSTVQLNADSLAIQHETTIKKVDKELWNSLLAENGTFDWEGCRFIEETYSGNPEPENNWQLHYLIIRDKSGKPVLATFFSELLCKDDMIAPADVSKQIELLRVRDKYLMTSKVVMLGSLMTLGNHLYIDRSAPKWKEAVLELLRILGDVKKESNASMIILRDFDTNDTELRDFFTKEGFIRSDMFNDHVIDDLNWHSNEEFFLKSSSKSRVHLRKHIFPNERFFTVRVRQQVPPKEVAHRYQLYMQVKDRAFEMNTFCLPMKFFETFNQFDAWEIIELSLNDSEEVIGFGFCYRSPSGNYIPMIVGIDYEANKTHGTYRQILFQAVKRAAHLKCRKLFFGYGADVEKYKFGTRIVNKSAYIQSDDNFKLESLSTFQQINYAR